MAKEHEGNVSDVAFTPTVRLDHETNQIVVQAAPDLERTIASDNLREFLVFLATNPGGEVSRNALEEYVALNEPNATVSTLVQRTQRSLGESGDEPLLDVTYSSSGRRTIEGVRLAESCSVSLAASLQEEYHQPVIPDAVVETARSEGKPYVIYFTGTEGVYYNHTTHETLIQVGEKISRRHLIEPRARLVSTLDTMGAEGGTKNDIGPQIGLQRPFQEMSEIARRTQGDLTDTGLTIVRFIRPEAKSKPRYALDIPPFTRAGANATPVPPPRR